MTTNGDVESSRPAKRPREEEESARPAQPIPRPVERLEPSFFGVAPNDEFTREVGNWIWQWTRGIDNVEIEAKIGVLVDTTTKLRPRLFWPVATEAIITDPTVANFESNMTEYQHAAFYQLLNNRVGETADPSYRGSRISAKRSREIDYFHSAPPGAQGKASGAGEGKARVTMVVGKDGKATLKEKGMITKTRVANMNVYSPKQLFDWRISISTETPLSKPPSTPIASERFKDRLSYTHQITTADLTKVSSQGSEPTYELEFELRNVGKLLAEGAKEIADPRQPNLYFEMIQAFINTIRMVVKNSAPPAPQPE